MTGFDYIILAAILLSAIAGFIRGFLKEICALITWIVAVWAAWRFGALLEPYMGGILRQPPFGLWAGRGVVFLGVLICGTIITALVNYFARLSIFSGLDRFLGTLLGLLRGLVVVGLALMLGQNLKLDSETWWQRSVVARELLPVAGILRSIAGDHLPRLQRQLQGEEV